MAIAGWTHRFKITSDNTKVAASYGYGLVFDLSDSPAGFWTNVKSDGSDIRVTKSDGSTQVPVGVREFDDTAETGLLYIKADGISTSEDTDFWVYYGNASAEAVADDDALGMHNVWSADHAAYYTMADGPSDDIINETGRYTDGAQPAGNSPTEATGQVGLAQDFTRASEERIDLGEPAYDIETGFSFACWIKFPDSGVIQNILDRDHRNGATVRAWQYRVDADGSLRLIRFNSGGGVVANFAGASTVDDDTWRFCVATFDNSSGSVLYVNGSSDGTDANTTNQNANVSITTIGANSRDSYRDHADGLIDELQVIERALTADEVSTIYNNQLDPSAFWTAGAEEEIQFVENVQATSLGSDSIQVTWDQFTNDDSPPDAADGYEIEIDSGTPIDVGDVQTYTDQSLTPSTQYSYRVRAYYSGSPTEYTEWSGVVQATTDAEELTTIPRSFVITADIKLRDEAPEVSEPPVAVTREYWVIAYRNVAASGFKTWRVFGGELLNGQTFSAPSSQVLGAHLSPDGNWLAYGQTSDPHLVIRSHSEGTLGSNVSVADRPDDTVRAVRFSYSGNFVAVAHGQSGSSEFASTNLSVYEHSSGTLTYIDSIQLGSNDGNNVAWNEDGDRLIFTETSSWDVYLVGFDGASLSNLASSNLGRSSGTANHKDEVSFLTGDYAVVGRDTTFELVSVAGDTFSVEQDSVTGARGPNFSSPYLAIGSGTGTTGGRAVYVYKFDGASLTLADEAQAGQNATRAAAISQDTGLVAHVDANNVDILSLIDDELTILDTEAWSSTIAGVIIYPGWTP